LDVRPTPEFDTWLNKLDAVAKSKIVGRIARLQATGHWGDAKTLGDGIIELRIDYGPGYRVYCKTDPPDRRPPVDRR